ncbi:uncharacterized protein zbbx isoform X3 [Paramormyrops kingsleyae]|uniref:uncharacterized protein zbbx isoform X3 n=1 Tax=Paramormyrops kingsleyae TaxID=1676925 RepID=UPI000CD5DAB2|nr:zinc finger B-box domain-containing protein 1 isoform X3 [Paramormyrops kingsleyae]
MDAPPCCTSKECDITDSTFPLLHCPLWPEPLSPLLAKNPRQAAHSPRDATPATFPKYLWPFWRKLGAYHWKSGQAGSMVASAPSQRLGPNKLPAGRLRVTVLKDEPEELQRTPAMKPQPPPGSLTSNRGPRLKRKACGQCEARAAGLVCMECGEDYCVGCFARFHQKGALKHHRMVPTQMEMHTSISTLDVVSRFSRQIDPDEPAVEGGVSGAGGARKGAATVDHQHAQTETVIQSKDDDEEDEEEQHGAPIGADPTGWNKSRWGGAFDEEESSRSFQEALREWRWERGEAKQGQERTWRPREALPVTKEATRIQADLFVPRTPVRVEFKHDGLSYMEKLLVKMYRRMPIKDHWPRPSVCSRPNSVMDLSQLTDEDPPCLMDEDPPSLTAAEMELKHYCASLFTVCDPGSSDNLDCPASSSASIVEREMQSTVGNCTATDTFPAEWGVGSAGVNEAEELETASQTTRVTKVQLDMSDSPQLTPQAEDSSFKIRLTWTAESDLSTSTQSLESLESDPLCKMQMTCSSELQFSSRIQICESPGPPLSYRTQIPNSPEPHIHRTHETQLEGHLSTQTQILQSLEPHQSLGTQIHQSPEPDIPSRTPVLMSPETDIPSRSPLLKSPEADIPSRTPVLKSPEPDIPSRTPVLKSPEADIPSRTPVRKSLEPDIPYRTPVLMSPEADIPSRIPVLMSPEADIPSRIPLLKSPEADIPSRIPVRKSLEPDIPSRTPEPPRTQFPHSSDLGLPSQTPIPQARELVQSYNFTGLQSPQAGLASTKRLHSSLKSCAPPMDPSSARTLQPTPPLTPSPHPRLFKRLMSTRSLPSSPRPPSGWTPLPQRPFSAQASGFCPKPLLCCDHRNNPKDDPADDPAEDSTDDPMDDLVDDLAYHSTDNLGDDLAAAFVDNPKDDFAEDPVDNPTEKYTDDLVDHLTDYLTGDPAENYMDDLVNNSENGYPGDKVGGFGHVSDPPMSDSGPAHAPFPEGRSDARPGVPDSFTVWWSFSQGEQTQLETVGHGGGSEEDRETNANLEVLDAVSSECLFSRPEALGASSYHDFGCQPISSLLRAAAPSLCGSDSSLWSGQGAPRSPSRAPSVSRPLSQAAWEIQEIQSVDCTESDDPLLEQTTACQALDLLDEELRGLSREPGDNASGSPCDLRPSAPPTTPLMAAGSDTGSVWEDDEGDMGEEEDEDKEQEACRDRQSVASLP